MADRMSEKLGYLTTLDDAARWGIEPMFSDFKSRGFGLETKPVAQPTLPGAPAAGDEPGAPVAVSTGLWDATNNPTADEKKPPPVSPETAIGADCPGSPAG
jgi:hypothetical protein